MNREFIFVQNKAGRKTSVKNQQLENIIENVVKIDNKMSPLKISVATKFPDPLNFNKDYLRKVDTDTKRPCRRCINVI